MTDDTCRQVTARCGGEIKWLPYPDSYPLGLRGGVVQLWEYGTCQTCRAREWRPIRWRDERTGATGDGEWTPIESALARQKENT